METSGLKKFAQAARRQLLEEVAARMEQVLQTDSIEIREKEAYLFIQKYATRWGGNPIEYDKAMMALWSGNPGDAVASQLLLRRGTVIIPLLLYGSN